MASALLLPVAVMHRLLLWLSVGALCCIRVQSCALCIMLSTFSTCCVSVWCSCWVPASMLVLLVLVLSRRWRRQRAAWVWLRAALCLPGRCMCCMCG
jgi:hypothetical protein